MEPYFFFIFSEGDSSSFPLQLLAFVCQNLLYSVQKVHQFGKLKLGDTLIMEFCCKLQELYGEKYCNVNLHLHVHLASCVLDFGPVYSFWLFSFERMNGILGTFHTNCRDVTLQLMRKFMQINQSGLIYWPDIYKSAFSPLIAEFRYSKGALIPKSLESTLSCGKCTPLPPLHEHALSSSMKSSILSSLSALNYFPSN